MISRASIIRCARTYLNTPFHHCGRKKKISLDCGGLVCGVFSELVGPHDAPAVYSKYPDGKTLQATMDRHFQEICPKCAGMGDILGFWWDKRRVLQHLGIITPVGIVHAYYNAGKCVETALSPRLVERTMLAWAFPEVEPREDFEVADLTDDTDPLQYYERVCCGDNRSNGGR